MEKRHIVLDTETTGLDVEKGHRIIEIGGVVMNGRKKTSETFHVYINPVSYTHLTLPTSDLV